MDTVSNLKLRIIKFSYKNINLEGLLFVDETQDIKEINLPLVCLLHGHNPNGAWENCQLAYQICKHNMVAFLPSMPGYAGSSGEKDYCGPNTVNSITEFIKILNENSKFSSLGIWGISRGAIVASQIIANEPNLAKAAILQSGAYDMNADFNWKYKNPDIKLNMARETEGEDDPWTNRSSINKMDRASSKILILHGQEDKNISVDQAINLQEKLMEQNRDSSLEIIKNADHFITKQTARTISLPFLEKNLIPTGK